MPKLSDEQRKIVELRDCNILVSAAAGSGKTRVLVERIMGRITDPVDPVDIDRILVLTFTNAAAAEMRSRIAEAIDKRLDEDPDNERLKIQSGLIYNAQITTIDSFCLNLLRNNFTEIGLEPGFRVADENEVKQLAEEALDEVLEEVLAGNDCHIENLDAFLDRFESKDSMRRIKSSITELYTQADKAPFIEDYIEDRRRDYGVDSVDDIKESAWYKGYSEGLKDTIASAIEKIDELRRFCEEKGPEEYLAVCDSDEEMLRRLEKAKDTDELRGMLEVMPRWQTLPRCKSCGNEEKNHAQDIRKLYKDIINGLSDNLPLSLEMQAEYMKNADRIVNALMDIVMLYHERFSEKKIGKGLVTFSDIEHMALRVLLKKEGGRYVPTRVAMDHRNMYRELMIDEYQDSNRTQEMLIHCLSGEDEGIYDRFMVGDVKQSIYRFRNADPSLFMAKYEEYSPIGGDRTRVDLSANYRSRIQVLNTVNAVFEKMMDREIGGVDYDEANRLNYGGLYEEYPAPLEDYGSELLALVTDSGSDLSKHQQEAVMIAERIKNLKRELMILDKVTKEYRKCDYRDIVILMRSIPTDIDDMRRILEAEDIPVHTPSKGGYFDTQEIITVLNFLKVIDNPHNEIELYGTMISLFGGFDEDETALLKITGGNIYNGLVAFADKAHEISIPEGMTSEEIDRIRDKACGFMQEYLHIRSMVPYTPVYKLLRYIYNRFDYVDHVTSLPGGEQRRANVTALLNKAESFCKDGFKGIFDFCRYIERLHKYSSEEGEVLTLGENANVVRIMTMHKSKGLEFPVCILAGLGTGINHRDSSEELIFHDDFGMGMDHIDTVRRIKLKDMRKRFIADQIRKDTLSEELRVLYVAMTRAEQKLIMCASISPKDAEAASNPSGEPTKADRLRAKSFYNILMMARGDNDWDGQCDMIIRYPEDISSFEFNETVHEGIRKEEFDLLMTQMSPQDIVFAQELKNQIANKYSHGYLKDLYTKTSVSELKIAAIHDGLLKGEEYDIPKEFFDLHKEDAYIPVFARDGQTEVSGAAVGSAVHRVMELTDYTYQEEFSEAVLDEQMKTAIESGALLKEEYELVNKGKIVRFLNSDTGKRMCKAAAQGRLYKEKPFVLGIPADRLNRDFPADETVLIQGIIDVFFTEDDHVILLDYKTDSVKSAEELKNRYETQLDYYEEALSRILDKDVTERLLYSFALEEIVKC